MSSNPYSVGLQNVGSFQVSGRPWLKSYLNTTAGYTFIEFPNVTKSIYIHNDHSGAGKEVTVMFCKPTRSIDMNTSNYFSSNISSSEELTVSTWIKFDLLPPDQRVVSFKNSSSQFTRIQTAYGVPEWRIASDDGSGLSIQSGAFTFNLDTWMNVVFTISNTERKLYVNGELIVTENIKTFSAMDEIELGNTATNFDGFYSTTSLFSKVLTQQEVTELYTTEARIDPRSHSQAKYLQSLWLFDDGEYLTLNPVDTVNTVYDRIGNNDLSNGGSGVGTFANGWTIDNAETRHSWVISGQQSVRGNVKTNRILLKHDNNDDMSIFASLTNIPAHLMHELTGPGIDD